MRLKYSLPFFVLLLCSCASLIKKNSSEQFIPAIGDLGSYSNSVLSSDFQKVGNPNLKEPISISVTVLPFTKASFKTYTAAKERMGQKPNVVFIDSLPNKPKYLSLELSDIIGIQAALNAADNKSVLAYLEKGEDYRLVSKIAIALDTEEAVLLSRAQRVSLIDDANGSLSLEIFTGKTKSQLNIAKLAAFDYELLGFCWGENNYGKTRIEALTEKGEKCPKNTERHARKLDETKDYLKL